MNEVTRNDLPEYREWSSVAVRLFQDVIYQEDGRPWDILLRNITPLQEYVGRVGLQLVIDETEGFAFLRQVPAQQLPEEYQDLPAMFRRSRLSYDATLLTVLLREELRRFEEEEVHDQRCVISGEDLFEQWQAFFPDSSDHVKLRRALNTALRTLEKLRFVKRFGDQKDQWEIRRVLKARVIADDLEHIRNQFMEAFQQTQPDPKPVSIPRTDTHFGADPH